MAQIALAWSLANDFVSAPIIGTTSLDNLKELLGMSGFGSWCDGLMREAGLDITLTDEEKKYIDEPYEPRSIVGYCFGIR